jgi:hypothetical protein
MPDPRERRRPAILPHKILILSGEPSMRRALKRLTTATGATTESVADLTQLPGEAPSLIVADMRGAEAPRFEALERVFPGRRLVCVVGPGDFTRVGDCLRLARCGSVITYDEHFEPDDFIITITKLLRGQIFGLQKYFPWGVTLYNMEVSSYEEKLRALDVLNAYTELAGARGGVRDRVALAAEELLMNAMYHAPVDGDGQPLYRHLPRKQLAHQHFDRSVQVSCASNGQHFAISVRDAYGSLDKETAVRFLSRAAEAHLEPEDRTSGAGLGLASVLKSASRLIFNLAPGVGTEAIALFDLDRLEKGHQGLRAVHLFVDRRRPRPAALDPAPPPALTTATAAPLVAGALALVLLVFGVIGVVRRLGEPPARTQITVDDGQALSVPIRVGGNNLRLRVERSGSRVAISADE